jgi:hypothetical protein
LQLERDGGVHDLLDSLAGIARGFALMPDGFQDSDNMLGLDLVERQLVQRLADHLHDALELAVSGGVFQAGLKRQPPLLSL